MPKRRKDELEAGLSKIGSLIQTARRQCGITQSDLAELLGISHQQVSKYERNADDISAIRLWQIARVLKAPIGSLYPNSDPGFAEQAQTPYVSRDEYDLPQVIDQLRVLLDALEKTHRARQA